MRATDTVLVVLAATRLTRLVTQDDLGRWYFTGPVTAWGDRREIQAFAAHQAAIAHMDDAEAAAAIDRLAQYDPDFPWTWQKRLSEGATCRWCVGFWVGALTLAAAVLCPRPLRPLLRFGLGALALNLVANAVGRWTGTLD